MGKGPMDQIEEKEFRAVVCEIWKRISLLGRWTGSGAWGSEYAEDEELMRRLGDIFWRKKNSFAINPTKYSDELWYSTLFLAQKSATNRGHGEALIAFWKNSSSDYHLQHNVGIIILIIGIMIIVTSLTADQLPTAGCEADHGWCWRLWQENTKWFDA